jgi:uncharacterized membrane protein YhhN
MMQAESLRWTFVRQFVIAAAMAIGLATPYTSWRHAPWSMLISQGLPTMVLIVAVAMAGASESRRYRWSLIVAFVFSQIGGYLLGCGQFVPGVFGFLAANIAYLTAFTTGVRLAKRAAPFLVLGLGGASVLALAWRQIPSAHVIPVCLYAVAIVSVPAQAIARSMVVRNLGTIAAAVGATLLLISDSGIAVNIFYKPYYGAHLFIMSTYFAGQWLIASSVGRSGSEGY